MTWENYKKEIERSGKLPEEWYILGIDLGTTNSIISYWNDSVKRPEPIDISNGFGKIPLPSVVQYRPDGGAGEWLVGEEAYRSFKIYPETTVRSIKRAMGTNKTVSLGGRDYLPEEISAKILTELMGNVQNLNPKAEAVGLVVSVPYDFDDAAKKATMRAVELAGLSDKLICLIEEPKAAALAYNFRHQLEPDEKILVFDFGGGTLDITLFHVTEKTDTNIRLMVISEGGEAMHGGDNIDERLVERCYGYIKDRNGAEPGDIAPENQVEIITRAREAKERLSGVKSFRIPFTFCIPPFVEQITREEFEEYIAAFVAKTRKLVQKTLRECYSGALTPDQVDRVLLEGGSSQMPWVRDMLIGIFNDESKIYTSERPALDISLGATYYAAMKMGLLQNPDMSAEKLSVEFLVTVPHDIGLEIESFGKKSFFPMIRRGTPYEFAKKSQTFTLSGQSPEDMTRFYLKLLERIDKEDKYEDCKLIGELEITGLPQRPSGKTRLSVGLLVEEEGGLVKGTVEDLGFDGEYEPSGFKENFEPERYKTTVL
ncbi:MAG: Hsp70 family protein [Clostridiales bacterium]|jgi:molecular chaperone DnaK (HSP70)|nr:Hsp70 family protein [Clostridiales bacterium]